MRFTYCACVISTILNDWSAVDKDAVVAYIRASTVRNCCWRARMFLMLSVLGI